VPGGLSIARLGQVAFAPCRRVGKSGRARPVVGQGEWVGGGRKLTGCPTRQWLVREGRRDGGVGLGRD